MQESPLGNKDPKHGQPQLWDMILDEIINERDQNENLMIEEQMQM